MKQLNGRQDNTQGLAVVEERESLRITDTLTGSDLVIKRSQTQSATEQMCQILDTFAKVKYYSIMLDNRSEAPILFVCTAFRSFSIIELAESIKPIY